MTIIKCVNWLTRHPIEALDAGLASRLQAHRLNRGDLVVLEAFLQLTNQTLRLKDLRSADFTSCLRQFVGAMHSRHFIQNSQIRTYCRSRRFLVAFHALGVPKRNIPFASVLSRVPTQEAIAWARDFERRVLDPEKVWCWGGWGATNTAGTKVGFPLYPVYARLGRRFTEKLHSACALYYTTRRQHGAVAGFAEFCDFIGGYESRLDEQDFNDAYWVQDFLSDFARHFFGREKFKKNDIRNSISVWNRVLVPFFELLAETRTLARPVSGFTKIRGRETKEQIQATKNIRKGADGTTYQHVLLTPVPLHVSDSEAKEILFKRIENDFAAVVTWAEREVDDIWSRHQNAQRLAKEGTARTSSHRGGGPWLTTPSNPKWLANVAATYAHHGHGANSYHYQPALLIETAFQLGLPTTGALFPHAALLVANHPELTTTFLDDLELFDKNEKRRGIEPTDAGTYLVGFKRRRGPADAEQKILLNARTVQVVEQVVALTEPLRAYLRNKGDDRWRLLFLTASSMTTRPIKQAFAAQASQNWKLVARLQTFLRISQSSAADIAGSLSLRAIRASAAVIEYLRTESAEKMSRALGHKTYSPQLLDRYLPRCIQQFFNERWIRLFQTGMIAYAMKDSPNLLTASGFRNMAELDEFLSNHAIRSLPSHLTTPNQATGPSHSASDSEVVIGVSEGILTALLSLQQAVESSKKQVCGRAMYWSQFSTRLVAYIRSLNDRPDLQRCLKSAMRHACAAQAEELIHE